MNITPNNDKIEKYLDELAEEYKELLFTALISRTPNLDDLSVSELLRLDNEIKKPLLVNYQKQQRRKKMLLVMGLTYMFLGFFTIIIFKLIKSNFIYGTDDVITLMSLVISFIGFVISIFSVALPNTFFSTSKYIEKKSSESLPLKEYEVITKWRELEGIVNDISINANVQTPRSVIQFLTENKFIDNDENTLLRNFLKIRNNIVHSTDTTYSVEEITSMLCEVDKVIAKIKKIV